MTDSFLTLDDAILPPPLGPIIAVLVALGTWRAGDWLAKHWRRDGGDAVERAGCFVAVVASVAALVHAFAWLGWALMPLLRLLGATLSVAGVVRLGEVVRSGPQHLSGALSRWRMMPVPERLAAALAALIAMGLALSALGPATDADSLDYHLGVPLDWLRHGGAYARPEWFHARLVGLGEALNLLGLAMGSEQLGAVFQAAGLAVAYAAVSALGSKLSSRPLAALLVMATPLLVFLIPNQKPMFLPAAATATALVMLLRQRTALEFRTAAIALICAAFAVGCKVSFRFSGLVIAGAVLFFGLRNGSFWRCAAMAAMVFLLLPGMTWARTFMFYGDPISPFLERFRLHPDPSVVWFAAFLRNYAGEPSLDTYLHLIWDLVVPSSIGTVSMVLGVGAWCLMLVFRRACGTAAWLASLAAVVTVFTLALGQLAPRFLLEPYLWGTAALVGVEVSRRLERVLLCALIGQGLLVATMAWFGAFTLAPGSLTRGLRLKVMERAADGAAEAHWMDRMLPADAVVWASTRSHALVPRNFVVDDESAMLPASLRASRLVTVLRERHVSFIVYRPDDATFSDILGKGYVHEITEPVLFSRATRNPFNRSIMYHLQAARVDWPTLNVDTRTKRNNPLR